VYAFTLNRPRNRGNGAAATAIRMGLMPATEQFLEPWTGEPINLTLREILFSR